MSGRVTPVPRRETIGARLLSRGAITQEQLEEAIEAQVVFGGRLGTNLLELGYVDEQTLNSVLSEQHKVPTLPPGVGDPEPTPETLALLPPEIVAAYRVVPLRREGNRLHVLMENPADLAQLDELAFRTGFIIKPLVASEARIAFLLERYFGMKRAMRYIMLSREDGPPPRDRMHESTGVASASSSIEEETWLSDELIYRELEPLDRALPPSPEFTERELDVDASSAQEHTGGPGKVHPEAVPAGAEAGTAGEAQAGRGGEVTPGIPGRGRPRPWRENDSLGEQGVYGDPPGGSIAGGLDHVAQRAATGLPREKGGEAEPAQPLSRDPSAMQEDRAGLSQTAAQELEAVQGNAPTLSVEEAIARLHAVDDRDDVARIILEFSRGRCRRAALFIHQRGLFLGWDGCGEGVDLASLRALRLPGDAPSVLQTANTTRSHLIGTLSDLGYAEPNTAILSVLGGGRPEAALLIPLLVKNRVVAVLYADNGDGGAPPDSVGAFVAVAEQVPRAFGVLLQKRKAMVV